jgi:hypothetical protein
MATVATHGTASNYLQRAPSPSGLADVVDLILDKGLVIDAYVRVAVIGIELLTIDARTVIASVDTYLRFAEAVNRLDLTQTEMAGIDALREGGHAAEKGAEKGKEAIEEAGSKLKGKGDDLAEATKDRAKGAVEKKAVKKAGSKAKRPYETLKEKVPGG